MAGRYGTHDRFTVWTEASCIPFRELPRRVVLARPHLQRAHTGEGKAMKYTKPTLKRLGSLSELTLTSPSCDYQQ
jgi:hypothetical protein